jgi:hypothetical protein
MKTTETPLERRERVTKLVDEKWPTPLEPNEFVNTIINILTGSWFEYEDAREAVNALAWKHLGVSLEWKNPTDKQAKQPKTGRRWGRY